MLLRISKNSKRIIAVLSKNRSPSQLAWGVSLGIVLGLIPKDNLTALMLIGLIAIVRVNQLAACLVAVGFTLMTGWFDPIQNSLGLQLLRSPSLAAAIGRLYQIPLMPWTCLDNAMVLGGLLVGTASVVPTYCVCRWTFNKAKQQLENSELEQVANDAIRYRKAVVDQSVTRREKPAPELKIVVDAGGVEPQVSTVTVESKEVSPKSMGPSKGMVAASSVPTTDMVVATDPPSSRIAQRRILHKSMPTTHQDDTVPVGNETILRETVIEVVRYRRPATPEKKSLQNDSDSNMTTLEKGSSMAVANIARDNSLDLNRNQEVRPLKSTLPNDTSISIDASHSIAPAGNREESLRYLLWHINGTRETHRKSSEKSA